MNSSEAPVVKSNGNRLETILQEIGELSPAEKAQLVQKLVGAESGLSVFFSNGHVFKSDMTIQINSSSPELMQTIVDAIAARIEKRF